MYEMPALFMVLLGCKPRGRHTEQHDVYFGIGEKLSDLAADINRFWPEAKGKLHIDAWRKVSQAGGYEVSILSREKKEETGLPGRPQLYFINLGGYQAGSFEEFHQKLLLAAADPGEAVKQAKSTDFFSQAGFPGASSHVDDKYGLDVDDLHKVEDILPAPQRKLFRIELIPAPFPEDDEFRLGYLTLDKLQREG